MREHDEPTSPYLPPEAPLAPPEPAPDFWSRLADVFAASGTVAAYGFAAFLGLVVFLVSAAFVIGALTSH